MLSQLKAAIRNTFTLTFFLLAIAVGALVFALFPDWPMFAQGALAGFGAGVLQNLLGSAMSRFRGLDG